MPREREVAVAGIVMLAAVSLGFAPRLYSQSSITPSRSFTLTETIHIAPPAKHAGELRVWIPMPYEESSQGASVAKISGLEHWKMYFEPEYRNRYAYTTISETALEHGAEIKATFHVQRFEHRASLEEGNNVPGAPMSVTMRLMQPDRLAPVDGEIAAIAQHIAGDSTLQTDKARKVYDYVIANVKYDGGVGELSAGDALKALHARTGDSAEFASLFVALARSAGVRARFEAGFVLPADAHSGALTNEHAWAQVYVPGTGWVPVDAADGFENKDQRDFYFGGVDANRVQISAGRDIHLVPQQKGAPLNYFLKPYAELDGKPYDGITTQYSFKDDANSGPVTTTASAR
jgi:transglutaminase-like putative cysteine protease